EQELKSARQSEQDVAEIGRQVGQLTNVVEMLANAVGETGHVKRLEAQIAGLADASPEDPRADIAALRRRPGDAAAIVDRLADLQVQQAGRDSRSSEAAAGEQQAVMQAIEQSVRSIYDRIDALETTYAIAPQDVERLTGEMAAFTRSLKSGGEASGG